MSSAIELKGVHTDNQAPQLAGNLRGMLRSTQKTLLQKAREDLVACRAETRGWWRRCKESRCAMVDLLEGAITAAERKGDDQALYVTYGNIKALIKEWYCEDTLKSIIDRTLLEVDAEILARQRLGVNAQLLHENTQLSQALVAWGKTHQLMGQVVDEKSTLVTSLQTALSSAQGENKKLNQQLAQERAENARLRAKLGQAEAGSFSPRLSSPPREHKVHPDQHRYREVEGRAGYGGPGLFGGGSRNSVISSF